VSHYFVEERYRKLQITIIKHKQAKMRKTGEDNLTDAVTSQILHGGEEIQEDPDTLAQQKYEDEHKYTRLHAYFEGIY
jgi:hypothetical protein